MKKFYRVPHFWIILTIMIFGAFFYYADLIPGLENFLSFGPFEFTRYSTYRILSLTPVAYAAFVFRWQGGVTTAVIVGLALLPRAIFQSIQIEAINETVAFFFIGLLVTWLIHREQRIVEQLGLSEEQYRGIFENSSDALFVCAPDARIISVNRAGEQLTGYSHEEMVAATITGLFTGNTWEKIGELFTRKLDNIPAGSVGEVTVIRKDGTEAVVELKTSPLLHKEEIIGVQIIAQDVTEEKHLRQNMEYYIQQVTRAQEDERLRMSRELHDDTAQVLANLSRGIDTVINGEGTGTDPAVVEKLTRLHQMADDALEGVRRFSQDLRPSILDDLGLVPALEWIITDLEQNYRMTAAITITGNRSRLSPEIELAVFRIAQEVLTNIRRHSQATSVEMKLNFSGDALTLVLNDNGRGFHVPERTSDLAQSGQLGIIGMRERARLVSGTLEVQSEAGHGTTVTLIIPRQPGADEPRG